MKVVLVSSSYLMSSRLSPYFSKGVFCDPESPRCLRVRASFSKAISGVLAQLVEVLQRLHKAPQYYPGVGLEEDLRYWYFLVDGL